MNSVDYDTNNYIADLDRREFEYNRKLANRLDEVDGLAYFPVALDDFIDNATAEEIILFFAASPEPIRSDCEPEQEDYLTATEALTLKSDREQGRVIGTDFYITEQGFPYIPQRVLPALRTIEAYGRLA